MPADVVAARFRVHRRTAHATALLVTLGLAALTAADPAMAQWKWRDRNGQLVISDLPPPAGTPDKDVLQRPGGSAAQRAATPSPVADPAAPAAASSATPPAAAASRVEPELEARRQKAEAEEKAKRKAEEDADAQRRADNCKRAKQQLSALESGQRMARLNDKGEREVLDDKARAEETQRMRDVVGSDCKP